MELEFVNHRGISELPKVLYKYRTWNRDDHKRLLSHGEIYFAAPNDFNEATECNLERDYDCTSEDMIREFSMIEATREVDLGKIYPWEFLRRAQHLYETNLFHDNNHREETKKLCVNSSINQFQYSAYQNLPLMNAFGILLPLKKEAIV